MSTARQIAANRLNAQKSAGPRSAEGKATSRANSLKTGLYARSQVIEGEDPAELRALADRYFLRWEPATPEESFLVATLIDADWLLRRYSLADAKIWDYQGADDCVRDNPNGKGLNFIRCREYFPLLQRRTDSAQRTFHRALRELERLQAKRCAAAPQPTDKVDREPPPEAKANFAQPQSAQQKIGFVPSFCPGGTRHVPFRRRSFPCQLPEPPPPARNGPSHMGLSPSVGCGNEDPETSNPAPVSSAAAGFARSHLQPFPKTGSRPPNTGRPHGSKEPEASASVVSSHPIEP
jgi:hypothetical protein